MPIKTKAVKVELNLVFLKIQAEFKITKKRKPRQRNNKKS